MDVPLLRKMTEKSVLGFGSCRESRVGDMITRNRLSYLRWCYFNLAKISYINEVLDKIKIPSEYRIEKPGINKELGKELERKYNKSKSSTSKIKGIVDGIDRGKRSKSNDIKKERIYFSKGAMQARNQGRR